jgi:hypothetical protein
VCAITATRSESIGYSGASITQRFQIVGSGSSVTLSSSSTSSVLGAPVTLTATIGPAGATGKVTFYDGVRVLGIQNVSAGSTVLVSRLYSTGTSLLSAHYSGDANYAPSDSAPIPHAVTAAPAFNFNPVKSATEIEHLSNVAVDDFNGDGLPDLVDMALGTRDYFDLAVYLNAGDGTLRPAAISVGPTATGFIATGDFNGDGRADIAIAAGDVIVFFGAGDGTFGSPTTYAANSGSYLFVADFNHDGYPDLAYPVLSQIGSNTVGVMLNNGDGTFMPGVLYDVNGARGTFALAGADANGDGKVDLIVLSTVFVSGVQGNSTAVLLGNGDGTFGTPIYSVSPGSGDAIAVADLNGDGNPDLAIANESGQISIELGNGDGTFESGIFYPIPEGYAIPANLVICDVNGDGVADVIALYTWSSSYLEVFLGKGDGTLRSAAEYTPDRLLFLTISDLNGDGRIDLISPAADASGIETLLGIPGPFVEVTKTHSGSVTAYQVGKTFEINVSSPPGAEPSVGPITVYDSPPGWSSIYTIDGSGWTCGPTPPLTFPRMCTRSDGLGGGSTFPPIFVSMDVNVSGPTSANDAQVSGGGAPPAHTSDVFGVLPVPQNCTASIAPSSVDLNSPLAATGTFSVVAPDGCSWFVTQVPSWLRFTSRTVGTGSGSLSYVVAVNSGGASRIAQVSIYTEAASASSSLTQPGSGSGPSKAGIFRSSAYLTAEDVNGNLAWDPGIDRAASFGSPGDVLITGDWNGSGTTKIGIFRPSVAMFALDVNGNGVWDPGVDVYGFFGQNGDVPLVGDWTGDGKTKVGIYRPGTALFALDINNNLRWDPGVDQAGVYGQPGDTPIVGNWTGDGKYKVGIFRNGFWALDSNGNVAWDPGTDAIGTIGQAGDTPLLGDWNGDGRTKAGIYRPGVALFGLDYKGDLTWDAYARAGVFGGPTDTPIVGDWDGTGVTRVGIYRAGAAFWALDMNGDIAWNPGTDRSGGFGAPGDIPAIGKWD